MVSAKKQPRPGIAVRARLRTKAQLTLPEEIRKALRISEGDEIEFAVREDGTITARGFISVPSDQVRYLTPERQAGERQAGEEVTAGGGAINGSVQETLTRPGTKDATGE